MTSTARLFFDRLIAEGCEGVTKLTGTPETEWLDFKIPAPGADEIRSAWSEAVAGFANNEGGVLVWGVLAKKNSENVDCAIELRPIDNPLAFKSRLVELLRGAAEPPVTGVQIEVILETEATGYVVCLIPQSRIKPHRAESVKNKPYIMRVSDNFVVPSVAMLRSLFYPGSSPQLRSHWKPEWNSSLETSRRDPMLVRLRLSLVNVGNVSAREVFLIFSSKEGGLDLNYSCESTPTSFGQGALVKRPIHPQVINELGVVNINCPSKLRMQPSQQFLVPTFRPIAAELRIFAADMAPVYEQISIKEDDLEYQREARGTPVLG